MEKDVGPEGLQGMKRSIVMKARPAKKNDTDVADKPKTHGDEGHEEERVHSDKT